MTDTNSQKTTIEQTVRITASPETVWSFWTDPRRICEWWGTEAEVEAEPGGMFRVVMGDGPVMRGTFTELEPPWRLVFSFGWEQSPFGDGLAPGSTRVEVTLTPDNGETVILLRHFELPAEHASEHQKGWSYFVGERLVAMANAV